MRAKEVYWDPTEKTLGILGLAPYATCDFYRKILDATPAMKDWEHIRILIDNNPKIPSRGRCLELREESPVPLMRKSIIDLKNRGADFIIIPCNTAHYFFDEVIEGLNDIVVLNMIEETSNYILDRYPELKCIGLLASRITIESKLYDKYLVPQDAEVISSIEDQKRLSEVIEEVKKGNIRDDIKDEIKQIADKLISNGAEGIIIGCTELSLLIENGELLVPIFDSNEILAKKAIEFAKNII